MTLLPPTRSRLVPCIAALAAVLVFSLSANLLPAAIIRLAEEFGVSENSLAKIYAVQFSAFFVTTLLAGIVCDKFGKRMPLTAAALVTAVGAWIWGTAPGIPQAYLGAALMGMGGGVIESMSSALLSELYPTRRKLLLNLSQIVYCTGAIGGPALMGYFLPRGVSWRIFFMTLAVIAVALLVLFLLSRLPAPDHEDRVDLRKLKVVAGRRSFIIPCLALFGYVFSESAVVSFCNPYLHERLGAPENWAIYSISIVWGAMALGRGICAILPESLSFEKVAAGLMLMAGGTLVAQAWIPVWQVSIVFFGLSGLAFAGTWPLVVGLAANRNPRHTSSVLGIVIATGALGCVVAPPTMALLLETLPASWAYPLCSIPIWLSAGAVLWLAREPIHLAHASVKHRAQAVKERLAGARHGEES